jgi:hypothetical protein
MRPVNMSPHNLFARIYAPSKLLTAWKLCPAGKIFHVVRKVRNLFGEKEEGKKRKKGGKKGKKGKKGRKLYYLINK